jgi:hypothetical protein
MHPLLHGDNPPGQFSVRVVTGVDVVTVVRTVGAAGAVPEGLTVAEGITGFERTGAGDIVAGIVNETPSIAVVGDVAVDDWTHCPFRQVIADGQVVPHVPQFATSLIVSLQTPLQRTRSAGQPACVVKGVETADAGSDEVCPAAGADEVPVTGMPEPADNAVPPMLFGAEKKAGMFGKKTKNDTTTTARTMPTIIRGVSRVPEVSGGGTGG